MSTCRFGVLRLIKQHNLFQNSLWCKLNHWEGCFKYRKIIQWKKKYISHRERTKRVAKKKNCLETKEFSTMYFLSFVEWQSYSLQWDAGGKWSYLLYREAERRFVTMKWQGKNYYESEAVTVSLPLVCVFCVCVCVCLYVTVSYH